MELEIINVLKIPSQYSLFRIQYTNLKSEVKCKAYKTQKELFTLFHVLLTADWAMMRETLL